jgi:hypothetical protein
MNAQLYSCEIDNERANFETATTFIYKANSFPVSVFGRVKSLVFQ